MRSGFTLTEVVVALVVLELGLLGVAGLGIHAYRTLSDASLRSRAVVAVQEVADSLARSGVRTGGGRSFEGGSISWTPGASMGAGVRGVRSLRISIVALAPTGETLVTVPAIVSTSDPSGTP